MALPANVAALLGVDPAADQPTIDAAVAVVAAKVTFYADRTNPNQAPIRGRNTGNADSANHPGVGV